MEMSRYVDATEQLVTEIVVRDIQRSTAFYQSLGFHLLRDDGNFVELSWEDHQLYLTHPSAFPEIAEPTLSSVPPFPIANVRVMVPDVDACWRAANDLGVRVV